MSYWVFTFPLDTLAVACSFFHFQNSNRLSGDERHSQFSEGILYTSLALAGAANGVIFVHTLVALARRKVFTPEEKWGALRVALAATPSERALHAGPNGGA